MISHARILASLMSVLVLGSADSTPTRVVVRDNTMSMKNDGRIYVNSARFTGLLITKDEAGHIVVSEAMREGLREGTSQWFDSNGRTIELRDYLHGEKEGVHRGWWSNGNPRFACNYVHGLHEGACRDWFESGALATVQNFKDGREDGLQQGWRRDGTIEFSYVRRNGRRYGLKGDLTCEIKDKL